MEDMVKEFGLELIDDYIERSLDYHRRYRGTYETVMGDVIILV